MSIFKSFTKSAEGESEKPKAFNPRKMNLDSHFPVDTPHINRMRTRAVADHLTDNETHIWMQAVKVSQTGAWMLMRVIEKPNLGVIDSLTKDDDRIIQVKPVKQLTDFRTVLKEMAKFENELMEKQEHVGPTKKELGPYHYETAAASEQIIFNGVGEPEPTLYGSPVQAGFYKADSFHASLQAYDDAMEKDSKKNDVSLLAIAETLGTEDLMLALENKAFLKIFAEELKSVHESLKQLYKAKESGRFGSIDSFFFEQDYHRNNYASMVGQRLGALSESVKEKTGAGLRIGKAMEIFILEYQLYALTLILKDSYEELASSNMSESRRGEFTQMINDCPKYYIEQTCKALQKLGCDAKLVQNFKNMVLLEDESSMANQIDRVLTSMAKDIGDLSKMTKTQFEKLVNGSYFGLFEANGAPTQQEEPAKKKGKSAEAAPAAQPS